MRRRLSERTSRGRTAGFIVLTLALFFVLVRAALPDTFLRVVSPLFVLGDSLTSHTTSLFASFGSARTLAAKNVLLAGQVDTLTLQNETLRGEVRDLTALIGTSTFAHDGVVAGVISRPPTAPYDTLVLLGGTDAGIMPLMEAYGAGGVPLGIIRSVTAHFSRLELFSSPGVATDAWVGQTRLPVALKGVGAGAFTASVSQASGIAQGDLVYVAGPGAVPVGRVAHLSGAPSDPVATLAIQPLVNPFSLTWVEIRETPSSASSTLASSTRARGEL